MTKASKGISGLKEKIFGKKGPPPKATVVQNIDVVSSSEEPDSTDKKEEPEDRVVSDIKGMRAFLIKVEKQLLILLKPIIKKGTKRTSKTLSSAGELVDKKFLRKIIRISIIIVFVLILLFVALSLFKAFNKNGDKNGVYVTEPTPTPADYQPYSPSVWAEDEEVLKIEEDINVLERELSRINIAETILRPPSLDFNVKF